MSAIGQNESCAMGCCQVICLMPFTSFSPPALRRRALVQHRKYGCGITLHLLHEPICRLALSPLVLASGKRQLPPNRWCKNSTVRRSESAEMSRRLLSSLLKP